MALKKVINLTEGPLDYVRGAVQPIVRVAKQAHQAGKAQSLVGDLDSAVKKLAQLLSAVVPDEQQSPAPTPQSAYTQPGVQTQGTTLQMPTRPQMTFSSYLQTSLGDQLNEGPMDFIKGALGSAWDVASSKINKYAERPSKVKDTLNAAVAGSERFAARGQSRRVQAQIQLIRQLVSKSPDQAAAAKRVEARLRQLLGKGPAERVVAMVFPQSQPQPKAQPVVSTKSTASWSQSQGRPPMSQPQPTAPKRTHGPGQRRPRPK